MTKIALLLLLGLAACGSADTASDEGAVPMQGWRMASGKVPSKAEFGAVVASCQDRAKSASVNLDSCLTDLGLRRSP
jgi:hypothetical protein